tara:strand:+ start:800 stop:1456 length:657 start_codon:yes stop_codon:yes gene_type:complete
LKIKLLELKKLLLTPFLLTSLFSFGGDLKAHTDSRYDELTQNNQKNRNSLKLQNSNSKLYLLNHAIVAINKLNKKSPRYVTGVTYLPIVSYFQDSLSCQRAVDSLRTLLNNFYSTETGITKYKTYFTCTAGDKIENANFQIPKYYNYNIGFIEQRTGNNRSRRPHYPILIPVPFAKLSSCNFYGRSQKNTIRGWDIDSYTDNRDKWKQIYVCLKTSNL